MKHYTPMHEDDMCCMEDAGLQMVATEIYYLASDVDARIAELEEALKQREDQLRAVLDLQRTDH